MRKLFILRHLWLVTLGFILVACGGPQDVRRELTLRAALGGDMAFSDPHMSGEINGTTVLLNSYEGLFRINDRTGDTELAAAESYTLSPDGLIYTFTLKPNLTFSDGEAINAQTFYDSWARALDPATNSNTAYMLAQVILNGEEVLAGKKPLSDLGVRVIDDLTLEVTLGHPAPYFLDILNRTVALPLPMHKVRANPTDWNRTFPIVSNGAYVLAEWQPSTRIVLERNPSYREADKVAIDKVILYTGDDLNTAYVQYINNEVDLLALISVDKIVEASNRLDFHSYFIYVNQFYHLNSKRKPLDDERVRRALTVAIDRKVLTQKILGAGEEPLYAMIPFQPGYKTQDYFKEDFELARSLLAEAGYPDGKGFPALTLSYNTNESHKKVAEFIQEQWFQNLGIKVNLKNQEWKTYLNDIKAFDYDIARLGWLPDYPDALSWLEVFDSKSGYSNYQNSRYDALLAKSNTIANPSDRVRVLEEAETLLMKNLPFIPLFTSNRNLLIDGEKWQFHTNPTNVLFFSSFRPKDS